MQVSELRNNFLAWQQQVIERKASRGDAGPGTRSGN